MRSPLLAAAAIACSISGAAAAPITFSSGYSEYTIATTGFYEISAYGAQGGGTSTIDSAGRLTTIAGGLGAMAHAEFRLDAGSVLQIAVGATGMTGSPFLVGGGGGGGASFVVLQGNPPAPLVIAGGGGGAGTSPGQAGLAAADGGTFPGGALGGQDAKGGGGIGGGGGYYTGATGSAGGAGFFSFGGGPPSPTGGGIGSGAPSGGYGGGGGGTGGLFDPTGGGGGGYGGGGGGRGGTGGGGGGSLIGSSVFGTGLEPLLLGGVGTGSGLVSLAFRPIGSTTPTPVPEPAALTIFGAGLLGLMATRRRRPAAVA